MRRVVYTIVIVLTVVFFIHPVGGDGDYYHHLNAGRDILTHMRLPHVDTYTYTRAGHEWVDHSWAAGVVFYLMDITIGSVGIGIFVALMALLTLYLLLLHLKTYKISTTALAVTLALAAVAMHTRWPSRPEIFAYPLSILLLLINRTYIKKPRIVWCMPIIVLAWANLYGANVIAGDILVVLLAVKELWIHRGQIPSIYSYLIASVAALVASLINGYGLATIFYFVPVQQIATSQAEWYGALKILSDMPYGYLLTFQYHFVVYLIYLTILLSVLAMCWRKLRAYKFEFTLTVLSLVPLFAFRQYPLVALLTAPALALTITTLSKKSQTILNPVLITLCAIAVLAQWYATPSRLSNDDTYPHGMTAYIRSHHLSGRVLNHPQDGGYISYELGGSSPIYADTRDELYLGTDVLNDYYQAVATGDMNNLLNMYHPTIIVIDLSQGPAYQYFFNSHDWAPIYMSGRYAIVIPTSIATTKHIQMLNTVDPYTSSQSKKSQENITEKIYQQAVLDDQSSHDNKTRLALLYLDEKKYSEAINTLNTIHATIEPGNVPFSMNMHSMYARAYMGLHDCARAKSSLESGREYIRGIMLFTPWVDRPDIIDRTYEQYMNVCGDL